MQKRLEFNPARPGAGLFHPAVEGWLRERFGAPTEVQSRAWEVTARHRNALIAAPTGSGKTLAAFLSAINDLVVEGLDHGLLDEVHVLYVSPLKALSNDIQKNLQEPLEGIRRQLVDLGFPDVTIRDAVRTGDTPAFERERMRKLPPHILVTTPESLFILLSSDAGRGMLGSVRSVIVDELHAIAGSKRGSHLMLSLERLDALCARPPVRIGLSATVKPLDEMAAFLVGDGARFASMSRGAPERHAMGRGMARRADGDVCPGLQQSRSGASQGVAGALSGNNGRAMDGNPEILLDESEQCTIIDAGHIRQRDLALELPSAPLTAVMANEVWAELYDRLAELTRQHRTTLIFVNQRRVAERVARHLAERIGEEHVTAHHGSLAKEHRLKAEQRLKAGQLKALVATSSLELGIDIGQIDLVCQLGSPGAINAFLQRVGRAGHAIGAIPKGRLFPLSLDDLLEASALLDAVNRGELDRIRVPQKPLDVLAQQIVAEAGCREWALDKLHARFRHAQPYRDLTLAEFESVVQMVAEGYATPRGRRGAYLHYDAVNRILRGRRGARLTAVTNAGTIPDQFDSEVVLLPEEQRIGTLNEDFAFESIPGDIFQLGNTSYRIAKIETGKVYVEDAKGQPPTLPFWLGERFGRTDELSHAVSQLTRGIEQHLEQGDAECERWLQDEVKIPAAAAQQLTEYLAAAKAALGTLPSEDTIVFERFFDEVGDSHLVIHSPFGSRINKAWGLALRKRFCRKFNFELQASALEDSIVLSLGPTHSFPLEEIKDYLKSANARDILIQAMIAAPMFGTRWRWNASIALAVKRMQGGRRVPPQFQRSDAEDLLTVCFPDQVACAENIVGDREIPDHPLVRQTVEDLLHETMDIEGFERLLRRMEQGEVKVIARDLTTPSPLAYAILNARPYAFLDDGEAEERRTKAVKTRPLSDFHRAEDLGRIDADAIERVREEAWPEMANLDELHDALVVHAFFAGNELGDPCGQWFALLQQQRRATELQVAEGKTIWVSAERLHEFIALLPEAQRLPDIAPVSKETPFDEDALREILRGRLELLGPVTAEALAAPLGIEVGRVEIALMMLEGEGSVMRGQFTQPDHPSPYPSPTRGGERQGNSLPLVGRAGGAEARLASPARGASERSAMDGGAGVSGVAEVAPGMAGAMADSMSAISVEWCDRRLLARMHRYTRDRQRAEIQPVPAAQFLRFLFRWHQIAEAGGDGGNIEGREGEMGLLLALRQLEGFAAPAAAWEEDLLPTRIRHYLPDMLDKLCASGKVVWTRPLFDEPATGEDARRKAGPIRSTPILLCERDTLTHWQTAGVTPNESVHLSSRAQKLLDSLRTHGASFFSDLVDDSHLLKAEAELALGELVSQGLVTCDSFAGLRALVMPAEKRARLRRRLPGHDFGIDAAGRWSLTRPRRAPQEELGALADPHVEHIARVLLRRYGVVFRKLLEREEGLPTWRELFYVYRRLEARGEIRGGRFVSGFAGEQFALPDAAVMLRKVARSGEVDRVSISAADPLNLVGVLTPGEKVPRLPGNRVLFEGGVPVAVQVGGEVKFLREVDGKREWEVRNALIRRQKGSGFVEGTGREQ